MTGRARGRARGRGQVVGAAAAAPGPMAAPSAAAPTPAAAAMPQPYSGGVSDLEAGVGRMTVSGGAGSDRREGGRDRGRRRGMPEIFTVTRPAEMRDKRGTYEPSDEVSLITNYFSLETAPDFHLYQYHVSFQPEIINMVLRSILVRKQSQLIGNVRVFDGTVLFLPHHLSSDETEVTAQKKDGTNVKIKFALTNVLPPRSYMCLYIYNLIFKRILKLLEMQQIGSNYYDPKQSFGIARHKLEVWPGFATSISNYENCDLLMCDVAHKLLHTNTVLDEIIAIYKPRDPDFEDKVRRQLVGQIVFARYNNKTYRIDDIDFNGSPYSEFELADKSKVSLFQYYKDHYQIKIRDEGQPLLISMPKNFRRDQTKPLWLIPELCTLTGVTNNMRDDFRVMKEVIGLSRMGPAERMERVQGLINAIDSNQAAQQELTGWGIRFSSSLLQLKGHKLKTEKVSMNKKVLKYDSLKADWTQGMREHYLTNAVSINNWILTFPARHAQIVKQFFNCLKRVCPPMGVHIDPPLTVELPNDRIEYCLRAMQDNKTDQTQLILCVLPSNRKDHYDAIKRYCCVNNPVPSQVVLAKTLDKEQAMMSVATKVAIQLNCKLGGEAWTVDIPLKGLMVVGIDSYHDSARRGQSVGAVVASMNPSLTKYYSRCLFQHTRQELLDGLGVCLLAALHQYRVANGAHPAKIIIYRDGVGDGQLDTVVQHEVRQVLETFKSIGAEYNPQMAFIVVKKRLKTRFFHVSRDQVPSNPPPGTVVDTKVTRREWYDFFLVSQSVRQGTASPTHYNVVYNTTSLKIDQMQQLAYKLTHLYYNWPGTISVPAPCQYAHKLAFLVGQSLHRDPNLALADKLFYL